MIYGELAKVIGIKHPDARHVRMTLESPKIAGAVRPGQFVNILCGRSDFGDRVFEGPEAYISHCQEPGLGEFFGKRLLRRPFAVHRVLEDAGVPRRLEVLFKIVGKGTAALAEVGAGKTVDILGPLGKGFDLGRADDLHEAVLIAGGVGLAPLYQLAQYLRRRGKKVFAFIGALDETQIPIETADSGVPLSFMESAEEVFLTSREFEELGVTVGITTERGLRGYRGYPTDLLERYLRSLRSSALREVRVYACGPWGMMRRTAAICLTQRVACEALLEERMGCGVGACMACSVRLKTGEGTIVRKRVCIDGPVFDAREVCWDE